VKRNLSPHEVRMVVEILEDPRYDTDYDPLAMARDIVRAINERRERERLWVAGVQPEGRAPSLHGPFVTRAAAAKYLEAGYAGIGFGVGTMVQSGAVPIYSPAFDFDDRDEEPG
jgi:hypothetical protein